MQTVKRRVYCVGQWPEDNYADFVVFDVKEGETDEEAIKRAQTVYSEEDEFYIK